MEIELTYEERTVALTELARRALRDFPLPTVSIELLTLTENAVFSVSTCDGRRAVLRVHRAPSEPGGKTAGVVGSELEWLAALRRDTDLAVPDPIPSRADAWVVLASTDTLPEPRACVMFWWLDGDLMADGVSVVTIVALGELLGRLHQHAARFVPSPGFQRGRLDSEDFGPNRRDEDFPPSTELDPDQRWVVTEAYDKVRRVMMALGDGPEVFGLIHADLHPFNCLINHGRLAPIDFDDCHYGHYLYDLAVPLVMIADHEDHAGLRHALLDGYRRRRPLSAEHEALLPYFLAARRLELISWQLTQLDNPDIAGWSARFVPAALRELASLPDPER